MSTQIAFLPYRPKHAGPPTVAELNAAVSLNGAFVDVAVVFSESMRQVGDAAAQVTRSFRQFSIPFTTTRRDHRRMVTRWARIDRRPALIHNGRKPR